MPPHVVALAYVHDAAAARELAVAPTVTVHPKAGAEVGASRGDGAADVAADVGGGGRSVSGRGSSNDGQRRRRSGGSKSGVCVRTCNSTDDAAVGGCAPMTTTPGAVGIPFCNFPSSTVTACASTFISRCASGLPCTFISVAPSLSHTPSSPPCRYLLHSYPVSWGGAPSFHGQRHRPT
jgi:hypothetical protein